MSTVSEFEQTWQNLWNNHYAGAFEYTDLRIRFSNIVTRHFRYVDIKLKYGVYIIRQNATREVLYIGKSGTIDNEGVFRIQNIPGRLKAVRSGRTKANDWFDGLLNKYGSLLIEYIFLEKHPISPAYAEAMLMQAYFNDKGVLPRENKSWLYVLRRFGTLGYVN